MSHRDRDEILTSIEGLSQSKRALLERLVAGSGGPDRQTPGIPPRGTTGPCVLSFNQRRQWFLDRLKPGGAGYNVVGATRFQGPLELPALRQALAAVVARHEVLRTRFFELDGEPLQQVQADCEVALEEIDLSSVAAVHREADLRRLVADESARPIDIAAGPPFRFTLYRISNTDHVLLRVLNHIVTDAWSEQVFLRDLGEAYSAAVTGGEPRWEPLAVQYADFACWQREHLTDAALEAQLAYWLRQLSGAPPALELVTDKPRPSVAGEGAASVLGLIESPAVAALQQLAHAEGATPFMVATAVYFWLLHLYSRRNDIVIGIPIAGRNPGGLGDLVGFFANSLPLRVELDGEMTFRGLLARVKQVSLEAYEHQDIPFDRLVEELRPERDLGLAPVFQTMLAFQNVPRSPPRFEGLELLPFEAEYRTVAFDLTLTVHPEENGWRYRVTYCTDLFAAAVMEEFSRCFGTLVRLVVRDPDVPMGRLAVIDAAAREVALHEWNATAAEFPRDSSVSRLFEERCRARADAPAVSLGKGILSYGDLNARANRLARYLQGMGVGREVVVGVVATRSLDTLVSLLAVLKAGGAYLPIDPDEPAQRLAFMISLAEAPVLICPPGTPGELAPDAVRCVRLEEGWEGWATGDAADLETAPGPGDLAYVIYTSGSTGQPKGVEIEHRAIVRLVCGAGYADFGTDRVFLQLAPVSFDASTFEIWGALLNGARLVMYSEKRPSAGELRKIIEQNGVTTVWLTATLFNTLVDEAPEALRGVRQLLTGGEALSPAHVRKAQDALPKTEIINGYGPTESTTFACTYSIPRADWRERRSIPIGRPIANTTAYVLDESMDICPVGMPGELYLGGYGLARGYLKEPEMTAAKFVADPFVGDPGARLYRTGDICRYLPDGRIEFVGRSDEQVKIRGFRIEPGEIVAALNQCDGVRNSAVTVRDDDRTGKTLVAYVVADADPVPAIDDLKESLAERLPAFMIPTSFVILEELPVTQSGKVDIRSLPEPTELNRRRARIARPRNATEVQLVTVWGRVLGVTDVGIDDNFFEMGGNSLLALRLFAEMENTLGRALPLATLFQAPTVRQLVKVWGSTESREAWPCVVPIQTSGTRPPFFCVHGLRGNVIAQRTLARRMGDDQPYYAIQARGLDLRTPPLRSVEAMAGHYVAEIRKTKPTGPYVIGGHCFGAMVALEMARILVNQGEEVPLLVMIDPPLPLTEAERRARKPPFRLRSVVGEPLRRLGLLPSNLEWVRRTHMLARDAYVPKPYNGRVLHFSCTHYGTDNEYSPERQERWSRLMEGEHDCRTIEGHHFLVLIEPAVSMIANGIEDRVSGLIEEGSL